MAASRVASLSILLMSLLFVIAFTADVTGHQQALQATGEHVHVQTEQGRLRGLVVDVTRDPRVGGDGGPTGQRVNAFLGVPYARPVLRFEASAGSLEYSYNRLFYRKSILKLN
jgi:hypothetical protein